MNSSDETANQLNPLEPFLAPVLEELRQLRAELAQRDAERLTLDTVKIIGLPEKAGYSLQELTQYLPLHYQTIRELYNAGQLKGRSVGGNKIVVYRWSVLEWLGLNTDVASKAVIRLEKKGGNQAA
jgi:hypothetical protein